MAYASERAAGLRQDDIVLEALPDEVTASIEIRDRWLATLSDDGNTLEFLVSDIRSWAPGQTVRVAFLGGDAELHAAIEDACRQITEACRLTLSFRDGNGYRTWTPQDRRYAGEIRVSFDMDGYFSLVGADSIAPNIGPAGSPVGGRPHQRSLNLEGFDQTLPPRWKGTVRHEFLHALAFQHEHQNSRGPCEAAFRWEDDPGYQPTQDADGRYIPDAAGRRPGIYTYLSGFPNHWSRAKVDHNLRSIRVVGGITASPFDPASCMLYRFPAMFYQTSPSPCSPIGDGQDLSDGDRAGLRHLYPEQPAAHERIAERRLALANDIEGRAGQRATESAASSLAEDTVIQLRAGLA
ncbi:hypothetical protein ACFQ07_30330 [Actinomadura adrarensis]|uniref:Peptidase metallopeptidase domain-containing protein n=1 Tax=Actinomadura adrarensis TaxID=1819600 RepID=A0ABW3CQ90_9ACTN